MEDGLTMNESEKVQDLLKIRNEIDTIDGELVKLFVQRMKASEKVAAAKKTSHAPVCDPVREREILAKVAKAVGPDFENEARLLFTTLMSMSITTMMTNSLRILQRPAIPEIICW